ncbi:hypothetical protein [Cupriavidus pauculus]|uniref:hypothetical protein n=1 Tax=Cupriavidus pauculus TaxID=82633 RepID=UPI0011AF0F90|nr:hypothetical protein [Cupriavidus pauculus]
MAATVKGRQNWFAPRIARHAVAEPTWPSTLASPRRVVLEEAGNDELVSIYINNFLQALIGHLNTGSWRDEEDNFDYWGIVGLWFDAGEQTPQGRF